MRLKLRYYSDYASKTCTITPEQVGRGPATGRRPRLRRVSPLASGLTKLPIVAWLALFLHGAAAQCDSGFYGSGGASCYACPAGQYCTGGSSYSACSYGTYSTAGSAACTACPAGYACSSPSYTPSACGSGAYSPEGSASCSSLSSGWVTPDSATAEDCGAN